MFWIPPRKRDQYDPVFANNTWAKIIKACQNKEVPETWTVGSQKAMTINGTDYPIDIIGKGHDDYADGSGKAPLTFQMHDCYIYPNMMNDGSGSNDGGWANCYMRTNEKALPRILAYMPSEVQTAIREVNKLTSEGHMSDVISTTADKLFLLSEIEVFGSATNSESGEGTQYEYYKVGNSKAKIRHGSESEWWTRSPYSSNFSSFCRVESDGTSYFRSAQFDDGIAFAFCF